MTNVANQTVAIAQMLANSIDALPGHSAKVWQGATMSDVARVYITGPYAKKGDGGYIVVRVDGQICERNTNKTVSGLLRDSGATVDLGGWDMAVANASIDSDIDYV